MTDFTKIRTYFALGPANLFRVGLYRIGLKTNLHPAIKLKATAPTGPFFGSGAKPAGEGAEAHWAWQKNKAVYFGLPVEGLTEPPDWHVNPFRLDARGNPEIPWWQTSDFDAAIGDIKTVWEASRFGWLIAMAQRAVLGDRSELDRLNRWLADWSLKNPPYLGLNWKCGQEASIRVMHLALAALVLGQTTHPEPGLIALVRLHLERIAPTIGYAIGQANNHGTSEAAALFIGGSWLSALGDKKAEKWASVGRRGLENRAKTLIEEDGTFSQYSVTYHRLMLDTYALSEIWRRHLDLPGFSPACLEKLSAASDWMYLLTDANTGDAPNLGANDGAQIISLAGTDYRDFRPSVQLACAVFKNRNAYEKNGLWDQPLVWLDINKPVEVMPAPQSVTLNSGGLHILRNKKAVVYLRYPRFRFRPSQADALHCDIWLDGENLARDAGTFSYNVSEEIMAYYNGTRAHNTVEFDGRDQMPRLGRFLFGAWLKTKEMQPVTVSGDRVSASASYCDRNEACHKRQINLEAERLVCIDEVSGFESKAILRWRLAPGDWKLNDNILTDGHRSVSLDSTVQPQRITLTSGQESRYYLQENSLPVLEMEVDRPAIITTEFHF